MKITVLEVLGAEFVSLFADKSYFLTLGLVSVVGWVIICILIIAEVRGYVSSPPREHMVVDTTLGQQLVININISFHALTCAEVGSIFGIDF